MRENSGTWPLAWDEPTDRSEPVEVPGRNDISFFELRREGGLEPRGALVFGRCGEDRDVSDSPCDRDAMFNSKLLGCASVPTSFRMMKRRPKS